MHGWWALLGISLCKQSLNDCAMHDPGLATFVNKIPGWDTYAKYNLPARQKTANIVLNY